MSLVYTNDRERIVKSAREAGLSDEEILKFALAGEWGAANRRAKIVQWGEAMGYDASAVLRIAQSVALVRSIRLPPSVAGKPLRKKQGKQP